MKNHIAVIAASLLIAGLNNAIAMDTQETPEPYGMSNEEQKDTPIIKNEFLTTYINELTEAMKNFNEYCSSSDYYLYYKDIIKNINSNISKIINIVINSNISREDLQKLRECSENLNALQSMNGDDKLIEILYNVCLNCHNILNELKCQYYNYK